MKKIKKIRMIEFIDSLNKSDKIILDKEKDIIIIDYHIYESLPDTDTDTDTIPETHNITKTHNTPEITYTTDNDCEIVRCDSEDDSGSDKYLYEPCKKKSRIDNNYKPPPHEQNKQNKQNKENEDSGSNTGDSSDGAETYRYELDNEIDMSIRNYIQGILHDKNKDD